MARDRRREDDAVDVELVDQALHALAVRYRQAALSLVLAVHDANDLEAVLRMGLELSADELRIRTVADDERPAPLHQPGEDPAANRPAREGDENDRRRKEKRCFQRAVDPPVLQPTKNLREQQEGTE